VQAAQGFHFSRPLPADGLFAFHRRCHRPDPQERTGEPGLPPTDPEKAMKNGHCGLTLPLAPIKKA
jgi:hypothetical protein